MKSGTESQLLAYQRDVEAVVAAIQPLDGDAMAVAERRQSQLTKPAGSLGRLEALSIHLAGITGVALPRFPRKAIVVFAADHGVTAEGVSSYPSAVTAQMAHNFATGGAAINALARLHGATVTVIDVGINADMPDAPGRVDRRVARGTANLAAEPAMTRSQMYAALGVGIEVARESAANHDIVVAGDMGIGNTTAAAALTCALTGLLAREVTGRGAGADDAQLARKIGVVERAIDRVKPRSDDPLGCLAELGGLEIAALTGFYLATAAARRPCLLDGFIATSAALTAARLAPLAREYFIAGHRSAEWGHRRQLEALRLEPLLDLDLRLGEGSGAALALGVIDAAAATLAEMATFAEAAVASRSSV